MIKYSFLFSSGSSPGAGPAHWEPHPLFFIGSPVTLLADLSSMPVPSSDYFSCTPNWDIYIFLKLFKCYWIGSGWVAGVASLRRGQRHPLLPIPSLLWVALRAQCLVLHDMLYLGWELFRILDCLSSQLHKHILDIFIIPSEVRFCNDTSSSCK